MKKLFKASSKQPQVLHDTLAADSRDRELNKTRDKDRDGAAISPYTILRPGGPLESDASHDGHRNAQTFVQYTQQRQPREYQEHRDRERKLEHRERDRAYRNSMVNYSSSDDISTWELVRKNSPDHRQHRTLSERDRSASLASLPALQPSTTIPNNSFPNPHPHTHPHPYANSHPQAARSASRTSSITSNSTPNSSHAYNLPSGASPPTPAHLPLPLVSPPPASAGYAPSPTSSTPLVVPAPQYMLKKKAPPSSQQITSKDTHRGNPGAAAILRALDPMQSSLGPISVSQNQQSGTHSHPDYRQHQQQQLYQYQYQQQYPSQQQQQQQQPPRPQASIPPHSSSHLNVKPLRVARSSRHSLSDIEFEPPGSDLDVDPVPEPDDEIDSREREREMRWRERDAEIEGRVQHTGKSSGKHGRGLLERLREPLVDGEARRERGSSKERDKEREREEKEKDKREDWRAQWNALFSSAKDKDRSKSKGKDVDSHLSPHNLSPHSDLNHRFIQGGQGQADALARMVGLFVTPRADFVDAVDWTLALDICEHTADAEAAKIIAKALRKELKYAQPIEQLGAITLWAITLQNASDAFITQTSSRKFLDVVEDVILRTRVELVRERLIEVLGAAVWISGEKGGKDKESVKRENFRSLWRKVKPEWYPIQGMPLTTDNAMFQTQPVVTDNMHAGGNLERRRTRPPTDGRRSSRVGNGIIPVEEDMRRLLQECKIGRGNAALLNEALAFATPNDLREKDIIKEFYAKCRASLELVHAQIPWATAGAERSRAHEPNIDRDLPGESPPLTREEKLLAELLRANEELADALRIFDDIERIGVENEVERAAREISRLEVRANGMHNYHANGEASSFLHASSRSQSPSSFMTSQASQASLQPPTLDPAYSTDHSMSQSFPHHPQVPMQSSQVSGSDSSHGQTHPSHLIPGNMPPPPRQLRGPRSPAPTGTFTIANVGGADSIRSRSSSPALASRPSSIAHSRAASVDIGLDTEPLVTNAATMDVKLMDNIYPVQRDTATPEPPELWDGTQNMSDKAAGKRKLAENSEEIQNGYNTGQGDGTMHAGLASTDSPYSGLDVDDGDGDETLGPDRWKSKVHYVYDAAAERTRERIREGMVCNALG